ncbi:unnamed protein product, partial [Polarella glacialis]
AEKMDRDMWYIHGNCYDLAQFVPKHPGGHLAILSGRGRDCTNLFESYHPWNDRHRKVLKAYGAAPPAPDPFYEELKEKVRAAFPGGGPSTRMRPQVFAALSCCWLVMVILFFVVRSPLSCAVAGLIMGTVGTRLTHEGAHQQISCNEWVNRIAMFLGYFIVGPSLGWHYRHVVSHHADTNQEGGVDVEYIWIADALPSWLKMLATPFLPIGVVFELGPKSLVDLLVRQTFGIHHVDIRVGGLLLECTLWVLGHYFLGPSWLCYLCMYWTCGLIFLPCSQVAHAILYPDVRQHESWAKMQIAESCDFATDSDFWYHVAFGLTTQVEHHLFPGIGHHCYEKIRLITREHCKKHGVVHMDISAKKAFGALWTRWITGQPISVA